MFCTSLVIYYFLALARTGDPSDEAPNWFVQREVWNAAQFNGSERLGYRPIKMVVIQHSVTPECKTFFACAAAVRELQEVYMTDRGLDVPYNFLIGGDGSVYEGRGWDKVGAHSVRFDKCAIGVGFLGDYRYSEVTKRQINGLKMLLKMGVLGGHLDPNFAMVGASDIRDSLSPGTNLYKAIQEMEHYDHENRYRDMVCEQMHLPEGEEYVDLAPKDWLLTREDWEAAPIKNLESNEQYRPLRLVVINNSQTRHCVTFAACKLELQSVQSFFHNIPVEIAYNFAIGNDGRVYEVRGWGAQPGGNMNDTPCAFNIGFIGDYAYNASIPMVVSDQQRNRTQLLLAEGVRLGHLHPDYIVVGAKDMDPSTTSPGDDLYNEIKTWDRYDHDGVLKDLNCDQIHDLPASSSA